LEETTDLEMRITMLEGAIEIAESGGEMNPQDRAAFLRKFVEDLRDDHHGDLSRHDHGHQAVDMPHGIMLNIAFTEILANGVMEARQEELARRKPSEQESHPDIGRPGVFAEHYKLVKNPWNENGWDYTKEVAGESPWHQAQESLDKLEEFDDYVADAFDSSYVGQCYNSAKQSVIDAIPESVKEALTPEVVKPVQYGCGDVYIDKDRAKSTGRCVRWQMAEVGVPVYGKAEPVTEEWLKENNLIEDNEEKEEEEESKPTPTDSAVMKALSNARWVTTKS
jgi:hypothetical protein